MWPDKVHVLQLKDDIWPWWRIELHCYRTIRPGCGGAPVASQPEEFMRNFRNILPRFCFCPIGLNHRLLCTRSDLLFQVMVLQMNRLAHSRLKMLQ